jgi:hypothetical protein
MHRSFTYGNKLVDSAVHYFMNRTPAPDTEPRRYQTNASLSQPPTKASRRPVREYVTNVSWRANPMTPAA